MATPSGVLKSRQTGFSRALNSAKTQRVYGRTPGDLLPPARSTAFHVPRVQSRVMADGGMVRAGNGKYEDVIPGMDGTLTCKQVEYDLVELARDRGVPADDRHITLEEISK